MKRLLVILMLLLPVVTIAQSELYKRYASQEDLTVAQVNGFKLNETVRVNVVLVVADNEAAWNRLKEELDIRGDEGVNSWLGDLKQPVKRVKWNGKTLLRVIASHARRTIGFYRIDNEEQYDALLDYQLNKMKK
ncbi:MAG: hypothetical protein IJR53_03700 [Bacteroidales bacterium]|nr:hypothetical protein [Bacteroidales bacterium]